MPEISFTIPLVPVAKGRPKFRTLGGFARTYTPKKTTVAENDIKLLATRYKPHDLITGALRLRVTFYMPIPASTRKKDLELFESEQMPHTKKPDSDNLSKLLFDALTGLFWVDDSQIYHTECTKYYSKNPRTEVYIGY